MPTTILSSAPSSGKLTEKQQKTTPRIASLLPGLTDVLYDLNLHHHIVANSHECDHKGLSVTCSKLPSSQATPHAEIAAGWHAATATHPLVFSSSLEDTLATRLCSFYHVNILALAQTRPTLILTLLSKPRFPDELDEDGLRKLVHAFIPSIQAVVSADCQTLKDIFQLHRDVALELQHPEIAVHSVAAARGRLESVRAHVNAVFRQVQKKRPRVTVVQWAEPLFLAGDWVPRVVTLAGGSGDGITREGKPSVVVSAEELKDVDIVVFAICAVGVKECRKIVEDFWKRAASEIGEWKGRIVVTDGLRLFSRVAVGTIVQSTEVIAEILLGKSFYGHRGILWEEWGIPRKVNYEDAS